LSTAYGITDNYYGGEEKNLAGTGQGNRFSGDVCRDTSCLIMRVIEKANLGMKLKSHITSIKELITAVLFVDDTDMIEEGDEAEENMQEMLKIYNRLYSATGGYIENKKCKYFAWY